MPTCPWGEGEEPIPWDPAIDPSIPKESLIQEGPPQPEAVSEVYPFWTLVKGCLPGAPDPSQEPGIAAQQLGPLDPTGPEGTNSWQLVERIMHSSGRGCRVKTGQAGGVGSVRALGSLLPTFSMSKNPSNSHMIRISTWQLIIEKTETAQKRPISHLLFHRHLFENPVGARG